MKTPIKQPNPARKRESPDKPSAVSKDRDEGIAVFEANLKKAKKLNALTKVFDLKGTPKEHQAGFWLKNPPLENILIAVKDNIEVRDAPTTAGTPSLKDNIADSDAPVIRFLRQAGAMVGAKTNMHELALGATSINYEFGTVFNPFDDKYTAGGSSGGSAVAVALGMVPLAIGTDTSGSCRIPASCCGIFGFRPSFNRYPIDGVVPISFNRDVVGCFARGLSFIEKFDRVLAPSRQKHRRLPDHPRIGIPMPALEKNFTREVRRVFHNTVKDIKDLGWQVIPCEIPGLEPSLWSCQVDQISFDMPLHLEIYLRRTNSPVSLEGLTESIKDPLVKERVKAMVNLDPVTAREKYLKSRQTIRKLRSTIQAIFENLKLDAWFYPTLSCRPPKGTEATEMEIEGTTKPTGPTLLQNTLLAGLAGLPSLSIPLGFDGKGLPVGGLLECPAGEDAYLLALAKSLTRKIEH